MARTKQTARASPPAGVAYRLANPLPTKANRQSNDMSDMSEKNNQSNPELALNLTRDIPLKNLVSKEKKQPDKRQTKNQKSHMIRLINHIVIALEPSHFGRSAVISSALSC